VRAFANFTRGSQVTFVFVAPPLVPGSTPSGTGVVVTPQDFTPIGDAVLSLTFEDVVSSGMTHMESTLLGGAGSPPTPSGFQFGSPAVVYDVQTTATFTGSIEVCIDYGAGTYADESILRLLHYDNGEWVDVTSAGYPNPTLHRICGSTTSLSPFIVGKLHYDVTGFFSPVDNLPSVNPASSGSAIPVKFALGGDRGSNVLADHYPQSQRKTCDFSSSIGGPEETVSGANGGVNYSRGNNQYSYSWKTNADWRGTCRVLTVKFADGQTRVARFQFK